MCTDVIRLFTQAGAFAGGCWPCFGLYYVHTVRLAVPGGQFEAPYFPFVNVPDNAIAQSVG